MLLPLQLWNKWSEFFWHVGSISGSSKKSANLQTSSNYEIAHELKGCLGNRSVLGRHNMTETGKLTMHIYFISLECTSMNRVWAKFITYGFNWGRCQCYEKNKKISTLILKTLLLDLYKSSCLTGLKSDKSERKQWMVFKHLFPFNYTDLESFIHFNAKIILWVKIHCSSCSGCFRAKKMVPKEPHMWAYSCTMSNKQALLILPFSMSFLGNFVSC